jgi:SAM-dependent methyltransferase
VISLSCPQCSASLRLEPEIAECVACAARYPKVDGVWRMLVPQRVAVIQVFLADYTRIRLAEGRGSDDPSFYRALPDCPRTHPLAWQWRIHRLTWRVLRARVLRSHSGPLRLLDLGAGVGWLCNRLAQLGHAPIAVDLSCDDRDGLGATRHYAAAWPKIQAEFDRLPLADASVDVVVFNASLHYSEDYAATLAESLRVLKPSGRLVVLETPVYQRESSGLDMVRERRQAFLKRYHTASDSIASLQFLTWPAIAALGSELALEWRIIRPWYGLRWALRPVVARLRRRREPSNFPILIATRRAAGARR